MAGNNDFNAEERAAFLNPTPLHEEGARKGERAGTSPMAGARLVPIDRIQPDPDQPRKTFNEHTLKSLAESIRELGGIIDPLTVQFDEENDAFKILSGERRYRAAKMIGLEKVPCIIKQVDQRKGFLLQTVANLQREDITPLEESDAIKILTEDFGYSQARVSEVLNKSPSYVSQILGLQRLDESARAILQTSEVSKEVQIQASKKKDPEKQVEMLRKASEEGKTVREIRKEIQPTGGSKVRNVTDAPVLEGISPEKQLKEEKANEWIWRPQNGRFVVIVHLMEDQSPERRIQSIKAALEEAYRHVVGLASSQNADER
jgi:ParB family chromosome partitioning protein